jgi:undecaprenyl-diphosphatase
MASHDEAAVSRWRPQERVPFHVRILVGIPAVMVIGLVFGALARAGAIAVDDSLTRRLSNFTRAHPSFEQAMRAVTFLGSTRFLLTFVAAVALVLVARHAWRTAVLVVAVGALGSTMSALLKVVVARPRPPSSLALVHATGKSFPSGHAMNSTIVFGTVVVLLARVASRARRIALGVGGALLVVAISFSRLALGVHHLADVVGGVLLGVSIVLLAVPLGVRADDGVRQGEAR